MKRSLAVLAAFTFVMLASPAGAQTDQEVIRKAGADIPVPSPTFPGEKNLVYKVAWDVTDGPSKPGGPIAGFRRPANFLVMAAENELDHAKVHLAIIVHGAATQSLLSNDAYKAATGKDNPNVALLDALNHGGVQIIVCGQSLVTSKVPRDKLLPFVKVATSATMARATLAAQGYATFMP